MNFSRQKETTREFLEIMCSRPDKSYCHDLFTGLYICENESTSSFLKHFTYAKTAVITYSNDQLLDYLLTDRDTPI
jgi:hypothetical protein